MLRHALVESYMEHSLRDTNDDTQDKHDTHEGDAASGQLVRGLDACSLSPAARPLQAAAAEANVRGQSEPWRLFEVVPGGGRREAVRKAPRVVAALRDRHPVGQ